MIVLDLEWNNGRDDELLEEILQIGAVRLERLDGPIVDTFSAYIRPSVHSECSPAIRDLPELQASLDSPLDFPAAYTQFRAWCGEDAQFLQWGYNDIPVFQANCAHWGLPPLKVDKVYDLQRAFSVLMEETRQFRLSDAVEYLRIPDSFCFHNALHDALYTALVGGWMGEGRALLEGSPQGVGQKKHRFAQISFPKQPKRRVGPFGTAEDALNAGKCRWFLCPVCGKNICVNLWYFSNERVFYSPFRCPEHGTFLSRLTLTEQEGGVWQGCLAVPELTQSLLDRFEAAADSGSHLCKRTEKRRRRRHRSRKSAAQTQTQG